MLDGRVKTLHPKVHGGILARRDLPDHMSAIEKAGIGAIDLVCVNLYPFEATVAKANVGFEEAIENIDIGGPSLVRAAAKNAEFVAVVTDPDDYPAILKELETFGEISKATKRSCAARPSPSRRATTRRSRDGSSRVRRRAPSRRYSPSRARSWRSCATARIPTKARHSTASPDPKNRLSRMPSKGSARARRGRRFLTIIFSISTRRSASCASSTAPRWRS